MELFKRLPFDIQDNIYKNVLIIHETQKNKEKMKITTNSINDLKNECIKEGARSFLDYLTTNNHLHIIYRDIDLGYRVISETEDGCTVSGCRYDKLYYDDLDYLMKCFLTTTINIEESEIEYGYVMKPNLLYSDNNDRNVTDWHDENFDYENYLGFIRDTQWSITHNLYDWLDNILGEDDYMSHRDWAEIQDILESDFNSIDRDNELLKYILCNIPTTNCFYFPTDWDCIEYY